MIRFAQCLWLVAAAPLVIGLATEHEPADVLYGRDILPNLKAAAARAIAAPEPPPVST